MQKNDMAIKRALISVSDKTDLELLVNNLKTYGVEIISTGGTKKRLEDAGISVTSIEKVTGNPEAFGGRMKTISFQVESALLYRRGNSQDEEDAKNLNIDPIDLVVCNLYPFAKAAADKADEEGLIENIDIGGPTMVRAAAKNYESVVVVTDPSDYNNLVSELQKGKGSLGFEYRRSLALKAFQHTASYDAMIANTLTDKFGEKGSVKFLALSEGSQLRYGENSHQSASYFSNLEGGVGDAPILQGKALSYNNLLDADAAWKCNSDVYHASKGGSISDPHVVTVVKHLNPCGVATADSAMRALELSWDCDPVSAFGGILCFNKEVDEACIAWLSEKFIELIIAPSFTAGALALLGKKKNLRVLELAPKELTPGETIIKSIKGGYLVADEDEGLDPELKSVTKIKFPEAKIRLAHYGIMVNKYLKSNSVALVAQTEGGEYIIHGAGMGQPNRIDALRRLAAPTARKRDQFDLSESVLISDAFFPFADSIEVCHEEGIKYIIQPGGSIRDKEVIAACDQFKIGMAFTGRRHFRH